MCFNVFITKIRTTLINAMGSHHHQVAILVLDGKLDSFGQLENFLAWSKMVLLFYPGPVLPPRTDGSLSEVKVSHVVKWLRRHRHDPMKQYRRSAALLQ